MTAQPLIRQQVLSPEREAAFSLAYRHSRNVRWLRRILPIVVVAALMVVVLWRVINPLKILSIPASVQGLSFNGSRLTMEHPRMNGFTKDNRAYRVEAVRAEQDLAAPTLVELKEMKADLVLEGGDQAKLSAESGLIDTKAGTILLKNNVSLTTTSGQSGSTDEALVSTENGSVKVSQRITLVSPAGQMTADTMHLTERGQVIVFDGHVKGWFIPTEADKKAEADKKP